MSTDLENSIEDDTQPEDSSVIKDLRQKEKRLDAAEADAAASKRELTLYKAGLGDLTDKQMKALSAAHEGDWDPESLKATASELGFVRDPADAETKPQISAAELEAHQRVANAAGGEQPLPPTDMDTAIANTKSPEELQAVLSNAGWLIVDG